MISSSLSRAPVARWALFALLATAACDDLYTVANLPPSASAEAICTQDGRFFVLLNVRDPERDPVDLELVRTTPERAILPTGTAGDGLAGLTSDRTPKGLPHRIEWAAADSPALCSLAPCAPAECQPARRVEQPTAPLSKVSTCAPRPDTMPPSLALEVYASDGKSPPTVTSADVSFVGPCSR